MKSKHKKLRFSDKEIMKLGKATPEQWSQFKSLLKSFLKNREQEVKS